MLECYYGLGYSSHRRGGKCEVDRDSPGSREAQRRVVYGYGFLFLASLLAAGTAFVVLLASILPEEEPPGVHGDHWTIEIVEEVHGDNIFVIDHVSPPPYAKWLLFIGTCLFLLSVFVFSWSSSRRTHTGVEVPVSAMPDAIAHLIVDSRSFILGKAWTPHNTLQDAALHVAVQKGAWTIELTGDFPGYQRGTGTTPRPVPTLRRDRVPRSGGSLLPPNLRGCGRRLPLDSQSVSQLPGRYAAAYQRRGRGAVFRSYPGKLMGYR